MNLESSRLGGFRTPIQHALDVNENGSGEYNATQHLRNNLTLDLDNQVCSAQGQGRHMQVNDLKNELTLTCMEVDITNSIPSIPSDQSITTSYRHIHMSPKKPIKRGTYDVSNSSDDASKSSEGSESSLDVKTSSDDACKGDSDNYGSGEHLNESSLEIEIHYNQCYSSLTPESPTRYGIVESEIGALMDTHNWPNTEQTPGQGNKCAISNDCIRDDKGKSKSETGKCAVEKQNITDDMRNREIDSNYCAVETEKCAVEKGNSAIKTNNVIDETRISAIRPETVKTENINFVNESNSKGEKLNNIYDAHTRATEELKNEPTEKYGDEVDNYLQTNGSRKSSYDNVEKNHEQITREVNVFISSVESEEVSDLSGIRKEGICDNENTDDFFFDDEFSVQFDAHLAQIDMGMLTQGDGDALELLASIHMQSQPKAPKLKSNIEAAVSKSDSCLFNRKYEESEFSEKASSNEEPPVSDKDFFSSGEISLPVSASISDYSHDGYYGDEPMYQQGEHCGLPEVTLSDCEAGYTTSSELSELQSGQLFTPSDNASPAPDQTNPSIVSSGSTNASGSFMYNSNDLCPKKENYVLSFDQSGSRATDDDSEPQSSESQDEPNMKTWATKPIDIPAEKPLISIDCTELSSPKAKKLLTTWSQHKNSDSESNSDSNDSSPTESCPSTENNTIAEKLSTGPNTPSSTNNSLVTWRTLNRTLSSPCRAEKPKRNLTTWRKIQETKKNMTLDLTGSHNRSKSLPNLNRKARVDNVPNCLVSKDLESPKDEHVSDRQINELHNSVYNPTMVLSIDTQPQRHSATLYEMYHRLKTQAAGNGDHFPTPLTESFQNFLISIMSPENQSHSSEESYYSPVTTTDMIKSPQNGIRSPRDGIKSPIRHLLLHKGSIHASYSSSHSNHSLCSSNSHRDSNNKGSPVLICAKCGPSEKRSMCCSPVFVPMTKSFGVQIPSNNADKSIQTSFNETTLGLDKSLQTSFELCINCKPNFLSIEKPKDGNKAKNHLKSPKTAIFSGNFLSPSFCPEKPFPVMSKVSTSTIGFTPSSPSVSNCRLSTSLMYSPNKSLPDLGFLKQSVTTSGSSNTHSEPIFSIPGLLDPIALFSKKSTQNQDDNGKKVKKKQDWFDTITETETDTQIDNLCNETTQEVTMRIKKPGNIVKPVRPGSREIPKSIFQKNSPNSETKDAENNNGEFNMVSDTTPYKKRQRSPRRGNQNQCQRSTDSSTTPMSISAGSYASSNSSGIEIGSYDSAGNLSSQFLSEDFTELLNLLNIDPSFIQKGVLEETSLHKEIAEKLNNPNNYGRTPTSTDCKSTEIKMNEYDITEQDAGVIINDVEHAESTIKEKPWNFLRKKPLKSCLRKRMNRRQRSLSDPCDFLFTKHGLDKNVDISTLGDPMKQGIAKSVSSPLFDRGCTCETCAHESAQHPHHQFYPFCGCDSLSNSSHNRSSHIDIIEEPEEDSYSEMSESQKKKSVKFAEENIYHSPHCSPHHSPRRRPRTKLLYNPIRAQCSSRDNSNVEKSNTDSNGDCSSTSETSAAIKAPAIPAGSDTSVESNTSCSPPPSEFHITADNSPPPSVFHDESPPPQESNILPPTQESEDRPTLSIKQTMYVEEINIVVQDLMNQSSSQDAVAQGHMVIQKLCPVILHILEDDIKAYTWSFFGRVKTNVWRVIEETSSTGVKQGSHLDEIMRDINHASYLSNGPMRYNAFICRLLSLRVVPQWFSYLLSQQPVLRKHYNSTSVLLNGRTSQAFVATISQILDPLSRINFEISLDFEFRCLHRSQEFAKKKVDGFPSEENKDRLNNQKTLDKEQTNQSEMVKERINQPAMDSSENKLISKDIQSNASSCTSVNSDAIMQVFAKQGHVEQIFKDNEIVATDLQSESSEEEILQESDSDIPAYKKGVTEYVFDTKQSRPQKLHLEKKSDGFLQNYTPLDSLIPSGDTLKHTVDVVNVAKQGMEQLTLANTPKIVKQTIEASKPIATKIVEDTFQKSKPIANKMISNTVEASKPITDRVKQTWTAAKPIAGKMTTSAVKAAKATQQWGIGLKVINVFDKLLMGSSTTSSKSQQSSMTSNCSGGSWSEASRNWKQQMKLNSPLDSQLNSPISSKYNSPYGSTHSLPVQTASSSISTLQTDPFYSKQAVSLVEVPRQQIIPPKKPPRASVSPPKQKVQEHKRLVKCLCHYVSMESSQLSYQKGDVLEILDELNDEWIICTNGKAKGLVHCGCTIAVKDSQAMLEA